MGDTGLGGFGTAFHFNEFLAVHAEFMFGGATFSGDMPLTAGGTIHESQDAFLQTGRSNVDHNIINRRITPFVTAGIGYQSMEMELQNAPPVTIGTPGMAGRPANRTCGKSTSPGTSARGSAGILPINCSSRLRLARSDSNTARPTASPRNSKACLPSAGCFNSQLIPQMWWHFTSKAAYETHSNPPSRCAHTRADPRRCNRLQRHQCEQIRLPD